MMKQEFFKINAIPAVLYGQDSRQVYLFLHGKCGRKEEAEAFAKIACPKGYQVLSIDLPQHGAREETQDEFYPWVVVPELRTVMRYAQKRWSSVSIRANSIGAYFAMLAFEEVEKALFVSPVVDMQKLILDMMLWAGVKEYQLQEKGEIPTKFGETLSWQYLTYVRQHGIHDWNCPICILYAGRDNLTSRETIHGFSQKHNVALTVLEEGEHWFHTPEQLAALAAWEEGSI